MNYTRKVQILFLTIGFISALTVEVQAQKPEEEMVCYLRHANGSVVNLTRLCGARFPNSQKEPSQKETEPSLAEKQAQFIQAFNQKLEGHPQGKEVLAQVDPDALLGKANQVCMAIGDGTYEPPPMQKVDELDERAIPNLEDAIVDQVARRYFCPKFNNER